MGRGTASHKSKIKLSSLSFNTIEEWRQSAIRNGYAGCTPIEVFRKKGADARNWYKAFKKWLDFNFISMHRQKNIRNAVLAEKNKD